MSAFPAILAGAQGALSLAGTLRANRAIERAADISQERIDQEITQSRVNALMQTDRLAVEGEQALGAVLNSTPRTTGTLEAVASRIAAGIGVDQFAINEELRRREESLQAQKESIVASANSRMRSPILAAAQGALGGFSQGTAIASGFQALSAAGQAAQQSAAIGEAQIDLAEAAQQTQAAQTEAAQTRADVDRARLSFFNQRLNSVSSSPFVRQRMNVVFGRGVMFR